VNKLYILCGIPFSGKTILAKKIAENPNFIRVDLDEVKFDLFGQSIKDSEINQEGWNKVYQEMYQRIEGFLRQGKNVVNDTGNFTKHERDLVKQIADKLSLETAVVFVNTPEKIAHERLLKNRQTKERFDVEDEDFKQTVAEMQVPTEEENVVVYNYGESLDNWVREKIWKENPR
jgi:predicted kinase